MTTATTFERGNATIQDSLDHRAREASARYLGLRGYEVLAKDWRCDGDSVDIVCRDVDGTLVFVDVSASVECFPRAECIRGRRARLETMAMSYLAEYEEVDVAVRFDTIGIVPVSEGRAFLRHNVNALGIL